MSFRLPQNLGGSSVLFGAADGGLGAEIASEKAASLGRAGAAVERALARLSDPQALAELGREALLKSAAHVVWMFFVQREACGLRDQAQVVRDLNIPRAVIVRIGAR
jgi:hypothetical protein